MGKLIRKFFLAFALIVVLPYNAFTKVPLTDDPFISNGSSVAAEKKCSKIRLTCVNVEKIENNSKRTISTLATDIIFLTVYYDLEKVNIKSENFGFDIDFSGYFEFQEKTKQSKDTDGKLHDFTGDFYFHADDEGLAYIRTKKKSLVKPCLEIFHNGYEYVFNIMFADIYDFDNEKWAYGEIFDTNQWGDKVKKYLREQIGHRFCSNYEESLEDRLTVHNSDDPWDNN